MIVLDASVGLEMLLRTPVGLRCGLRALRDDASLHAPALLDVECTHVLRRLEAGGEIDVRTGTAILGALAALPLQRHDHVDLLPRIWQLRRSVTAYDAAYLALAEALDAPLLTCDRKLARAHGHGARIETMD